ncbi:hypothetical protein WJX73_009288 [Symbiochloris irregularis]|uniref:Uncharacterized protein n=1 Tax=Symbiochloris irregularis TaxID=706552 RepID=A0AAW1NYD4_9CHLO
MVTQLVHGELGRAENPSILHGHLTLRVTLQSSISRNSLDDLASLLPKQQVDRQRQQEQLQPQPQLEQMDDIDDDDASSIVIWGLADANMEGQQLADLVQQFLTEHIKARRSLHVVDAHHLAPGGACAQ